MAEREQQVNEESENVERLKAIAEEDLKKAEPALIAAEEGLANLTKSSQIIYQPKKITVNKLSEK